MNENEIAVLADCTRRIYLKLKQLQAIAAMPEPDMARVAVLVQECARLAYEQTEVTRRTGSPGPDISAQEVFNLFEEQLTFLGLFSAMHLKKSKDRYKHAEDIKRRLAVIVPLCDRVLACRNIQQAVSRPVMQVPPPALAPAQSTADQNRSQKGQDPVRIKSHLQVTRLATDVNSILANLQDLIRIAEAKPFSLLETAELTGHVLNLIAAHVTINISGPGAPTPVSREWVKMAAEESIENLTGIYLLAIRMRTDQGLREQHQTRISRQLAGTFVTLRSIYLAPNIQEEIRRVDQQAN